jgi:hypothetical protein
MLPRARGFLLPALSLVYVGVTASLLGTGPLPWVLSAAVLFFAAWAYRRTESFTEDARSVSRATAFGLASWCAARLGPDGNAVLDAAANVGVGTTAVASLVALSRIDGPGGVLGPPRAARSLDAALLVGFLWSIATALPLTYALLPGYRVLFDPLAIDYATTSAGAATLILSVAAAYRLRVLRRFELGVGDRAAGALALAITALAIALPASLLDVAAPDRVLPVAVLVGATMMTWASTIAEPTTVSSALRGILAVMILGTPVTLVAGLAARTYPGHAGGIVLGTAALSIVVGLLGRSVARPLGPEQSRWLEALDNACRAALEPAPDAALQAALHALARVSTTPGARAEIWRNHPGEVLSVDVAGYLHVEPGEAPERLYELGLSEPERTLRADALREVQVRRPEVRGLVGWFDARDAFSATIVTDDAGPAGFILLPRAGRTSLLTLEEARMARLLADRISALLTVTSALSRARERERAAATRLDTLEGDRERLASALTGGGARHRVNAERLAARVRGAAYAPASRLTLEALERSGQTGAGLALVTPPGVDAIGWAAHAHLASERAGGPFVIVDATQPAERTPERWNDPEHSPSRLVDGGTLLVLDVDAIPLEVQELLLATLNARAKADDSALPAPGLIVTAHASATTLTALGKISPALRRALPREITLPAVAERAEDLRALVLDGLARASLRVGREPLGVDPSALRLLVDHTWPGNEIELDGVLLRAARVARGALVTPDDLALAGFDSRPPPRPEPTPAAPVTRRRAPRRFARGR